MKTLLVSFFLLFIFDVNAKIIYVEPVRNANYVSINNNIIIGFDEKIISSNLSSLISVTGSQSGNHPGEIILTPDRNKLMFKPYQPFAFGEQVEVRLNGLKTVSYSNNKLAYAFQTQFSKPEIDNSKIIEEELNLSENNFLFSNDYALLPQLTVTASNNPSPGHLFLSNYAMGGYDPNIIIANNDGTPFYFRQMIYNTVDFNRQPNGLIVYYLAVPGKYYAEDNQHNIIDSFYCGNGYTTDAHELRVLNNGHALLISYDPQIIDMSVIVPGGSPNATVTGLIVQEIDENKNVVFQWRSWDHFNIVDAIYVNLTLPIVDCVHGNAIELDNDGNLMISSRHLSEITKINRATGDIIWRMGGVNNQFTFINDTIPFHYQHNIRRISNGNITLYDNGNFRTPLFSRALEYQLDEVNKTATLVWEYRHTPDIYGSAMGMVQRLQNGNTLIGWGSTNPTISEVTPAGNTALEMSLPTGVYTYRVFKDQVNVTLNVKLAIEGFYNTQNNKLNMKDTVRVYLRNINSPYNIVDSSRSVIDSVNFTGNFRYYNVTSGTYYISINHRNGLETWSKAGGEAFTSGGVYLYNYTTSNSQAYGNNLFLKGTKYCIYSGDVNQDGVINAIDLSSIDNGAFSFVTGYESGDLDGNNFIDAFDLSIAEKNSSNFVGKMTPP